VSLTLGSPYSGDYSITPASGNGTALTITAASSTSGGSTSGSSSSGSSGFGTQGGITSTNFPPVSQTVDLYQKLPSLPGISFAGKSTNNASTFPSSSGNSTVLGETANTSLAVIQPSGDDMTGDGILSVQEVKQ
jgi:type IV secretory pathway TrbL component